MVGVYKIVRVDPIGRRTSCSAYGYKSLTVEYHHGKWTKATIGGLLVFDNEEDAVAFAEYLHMPPLCYWELWFANAYWPIRLPRERPDIWLSSNEDLKSLWKTKAPRIGAQAGPWPAGTKAYKFVRLERRLAP